MAARPAGHPPSALPRVPWVVLAAVGCAFGSDAVVGGGGGTVPPLSPGASWGRVTVAGDPLCRIRLYLQGESWVHIEETAEFPGPGLGAPWLQRGEARLGPLQPLQHLTGS